MKRFTSFMLMLLCAVTTWAGPTDLPTLTTDEANPVWYTISNTRSASGKYIYWNGDNAEIQDANTASGASFFYFTGTKSDGVLTVKIHNFATDKLFASNNSWTTEGTDVTIGVTPHGDKNTGLYIGFNDTYLNERNSNSGYTTWGADDAGSIFVMNLVTDFTSVIDVPAAKTAAIAEVELLATASVIYPDATDAVNAINDVTAAGTGLAELDAAIKAIDKIVADYKVSALKALDGKYFALHSAGCDRYVEVSNSVVAAVQTVNTPAAYWQFVENEGYVNVYNPYTGKYLCATSFGEKVALTEEKANACKYDVEVVVNDETSAVEVRFLLNDGSYLHVNGTLLTWYDGGSSRWTLTEAKDFSTMISNYKTSTLATLDQWVTLSVVFDASLIVNAKAAINAINTTDFATFAAIDAEIKKVTDAVAAKMFTFQTTANDSHREGVWVSANPSTGKAIGLHGESNYNSIWSLRHAGGVSFYMFNELNQVYMGAPSANCPLTEAPTTAYTFEIVDAKNAIVEMHVGGETLHASNHADDKLLSWDGDEAASRWYIRTIDLAADIQTILDGLTEADYAEVPELGQYPTAAYEALVEARTTAKTVEAVEAAIAAFKKAKNVPVYFIRSAHNGYAAGSAIYYDGAWKWKAANKYDKQMWMTIPAYAQENVPVVDAYKSEGTSYEICDYLTGTVMRGKSVQIVKIDGLDNAYNLQYNADANSTDASHHAKDNGQLVNWKPGTANDALASAWYVDYLGTSYDLDQLFDEKIAALAGLQTAYNAKAFYADAEMGDGLGQYKGNKEAIVTALAAAEVIGSKTLAQQAILNIADINAATTALNGAAALEINLPEEGKYYRIKGACEDVLPGYYLSSNDNPDRGRIACVKDADASTIFYYKDGKLLSYKSGLYLALDKDNWKYSSVDGKTPASTVTFAGSPRVAGAYTVLSDDRYLHYTSTDYHGGVWTVQIDRCANDTDAKHDWTIEEVTSLPVSITAAGYATFYAPVAVAVPTGVTAHTVTINGDWATLSEALEVIPANTGVVLAGAEYDYDFAITTADAFKGENLMVGTIAKTLVTKPENTECYVLAKGVNDVGMYVAKNGENTAEFLNAGHKAYLAVKDAPEATASYSFRFGEGTTGVENVEVENTVKAIYDLTGRRVEAITAAGIYIVNGKKVLVK